MYKLSNDLSFDSQTSVSNPDVDSVKKYLSVLINSSTPSDFVLTEMGVDEKWAVAEEILAGINNAQTKLCGLLNDALNLVDWDETKGNLR